MVMVWKTPVEILGGFTHRNIQIFTHTQKKLPNVFELDSRFAQPCSDAQRETHKLSGEQPELSLSDWYSQTLLVAYERKHKNISRAS